MTSEALAESQTEPNLDIDPDSYTALRLVRTVPRPCILPFTDGSISNMPRPSMSTSQLVAAS